MSLRFTILGCGSSGGVPRVGNDWGACDPENPRNRRRRCSALVERFDGGRATRLLVDSSPDLREQALAHRIEHLDGVLYTHDHADHTHGIDDLRFISYRMKRRIDVYVDTATRASLESRFGYCFATPPGSSYPPILRAHGIEPGLPLRIAGAGGVIEALPVPQEHGDIASLGFRFGDVAYSPDISGLSDDSVAMLAGLDVWIVDALRYLPHPSHWSVSQALQWIDRVGPKRAVLTHLHIDLDFAALKRELPAHVEPAYDGMVIDIE